MPRRTFEIAERARARGLLDQLREVGVVRHRGMDGALVEREQRLLLELDDKVQRQRALREKAANAAEVAALEREIDRQLRQLSDLRAEIRSSHPRHALWTRPEVELADLQQTILPTERPCSSTFSVSGGASCGG